MTEFVTNLMILLFHEYFFSDRDIRIFRDVKHLGDGPKLRRQIQNFSDSAQAKVEKMRVRAMKPSPGVMMELRETLQMKAESHALVQVRWVNICKFIRLL